MTVAALVFMASSSRTRQVQTLGVLPLGPVADLRAGQQLCEAPVGLDGDVDAITFNPATRAQSSPAMTVTVRADGDRHVLGRGVLRAGFDPAVAQTVNFGRVHGGQLVALCFRNDGPARMSLFGDQLTGSLTCTPSGRTAGVSCQQTGGIRPTLTTASASVDGRPPLPGDIAADLLREQPRSLLQRVPALIAGASVFRPGFVGPALWWVLLAGWLLLLPLGVAYAAAAATRGTSAGDGRDAG